VVRNPVFVGIRKDKIFNDSSHKIVVPILRRVACALKHHSGGICETLLAERLMAIASDVHGTIPIIIARNHVGHGCLHPPEPLILLANQIENWNIQVTLTLTDRCGSLTCCEIIELARPAIDDHS